MNDEEDEDKDRDDDDEEDEDKDEDDDDEDKDEDDDEEDEDNDEIRLFFSNLANADTLDRCIIRSSATIITAMLSGILTTNPISVLRNYRKCKSCFQFS